MFIVINVIAQQNDLKKKHNSPQAKNTSLKLLPHKDLQNLLFFLKIIQLGQTKLTFIYFDVVKKTCAIVNWFSDVIYYFAYTIH